jgi:hypothetical protein
MKLDKDSEALWLQSLDRSVQARFLTALACNLTIDIRVFCYSGEDVKQALEWVRLVNEINHRVVGYLSHYHAGDDDMGWLTVVADYVLNSKDPVVHQQAEQAWLHAKGVVANE